MRTKGFVVRLVVASIIAWTFYSAVDYFAVHNWGDSDSLIVKVIDAGPESIIPPESEEEDDNVPPVTFYKPNTRWKGPRTDERINRMLSECISLLRGLGVPVSGSVCPTVRLNSSHCHFGTCCLKGSKKKYTEYEFYIEISGFTLKNTEKSLRNTLIHELLHTVPGGLCHTGEWKKWAKWVNANTEYHISRCGTEDETDKDLDNLSWVYLNILLCAKMGGINNGKLCLSGQ